MTRSAERRKHPVAAVLVVLASAFADARVAQASYWDSLQREWARVTQFFLGERMEARSTAEAPTTLTALQRQAILGELRQVLVPQSAAQPASIQWTAWRDAWEAGASLEGIHNGILESPEYRAVEAQSAATPAALLNWASAESALLRREIGLASAPWESAAPSLLALKRRLMSEAIRALEAARGPDGRDRVRQARWYGRWVVRLRARIPREAGRLSFGLALRDRDGSAGGGAEAEEFHRRWAEEAPQDLVVWELLNRYHRVINHFFVSSAPSLAGSERAASKESSP